MDDRERFRIGCFNTFNLVSQGKKYYRHEVYDAEEYDKKVSWIGRQLGDMKADLVGFQEIFHVEALEDAISRSGCMRGHRVYAAGTSGHHPEVALATRFNVQEFDRIEEFDESMKLKLDDDVTVPLDRFTHAVLRVRLEIKPEFPVTVFVAHLKSKRPKFLEDEDRRDPVIQAMARSRSLVLRATEAAALRKLLLDEMKGNDRGVIVIGDLNDTETAVTSAVVAGDPPPRHWEHDRKRRVWDTLLYNTKSIQARQSYRDVYYTHIYNGQYESLDHILVSEEFYRQNRGAPAYVEYVQVLNDHLIDETFTDEEVPRWKSDHAQVVATICVR